MKTRSGFVSNSSSSSFIVIGTGIPDRLHDIWGDDTYVIGKDGMTEFGWGPGVAKDQHSRINFAAIQAKDAEDAGDGGPMAMLLEAIKRNSDAGTIECVISDDYDSGSWGYIDHQSARCEGCNMEMFDDMEALERFLFSPDSKIVLDNDNH